MRYGGYVMIGGAIAACGERIDPAAWMKRRHLNDDWIEHNTLLRWLWRAAYLREREARDLRRAVAMTQLFAQHAAGIVRNTPHSCVSDEHCCALRVAHKGAAERIMEAARKWLPEPIEPHPHRARWLDAAADRVAAGEPVEQVMADFGWRRA